MKPARTRFAPSPTGYLHVGGVRTALFAWLLARQSGGQFILRLEDTDKNREVEGSGEHIMKSLRWLGLNWDEGIGEVGGPHAPYTQSERLDSYRQWIQILVDAGRAYTDPYTPEEVQKFREEAQAAGKPFLYRDYRPENTSPWDDGQAVRFKSDPKAYDWHDAVLGDRHSGPEAIDDFIILKSDSYPTYNFAHIIDDHEMAVTHVIRGQEFLASVPNYLNLYEALGFTPPILATMPHVLGPDGKKKLSKRDGAKDVLDYAREGFLPEALINFMASLGWNDGTEQEIFSVEELIQKFSLEHVQKSGARFDEQRLIWMNGTHIRELSLDELFNRALEFWPPESAPYDDDYKRRVLAVTQERLKFLGELPELTRFFFVDLPLDPALISEHKQLKKLTKTELHDLLVQARASLDQSDFSVEDLQNRLNQLLQASDQKPAVLFSLIRIATTQAPASPGLSDTLAILGKERSLTRLDGQLQALS